MHRRLAILPGLGSWPWPGILNNNLNAGGERRRLAGRPGLGCLPWPGGLFLKCGGGHRGRPARLARASLPRPGVLSFRLAGCGRGRGADKPGRGSLPRPGFLLPVAGSGLRRHAACRARAGLCRSASVRLRGAVAAPGGPGAAGSSCPCPAEPPLPYLPARREVVRVVARKGLRPVAAASLAGRPRLPRPLAAWGRRAVWRRSVVGRPLLLAADATVACAAGLTGRRSRPPS